MEYTQKQQEIIDFWFGELFADGLAQSNARNKWFSVTADYDREITKKFERDLKKAGRGEYDAWRETPEGSLALILLLDQFARNIYRDLEDMYKYGKAAEEIAAHAIEKGFDRVLPISKRQFVYMPFMHAENVALQNQSVKLFEELYGEVVEHIKEYIFLDYARKYQIIIEQFGRFPHRNEILGRESTLDEITFLQKPGSSF